MTAGEGARFRLEADRCREMADKAHDADIAAHWRRLTEEYEALAEVAQAARW